MSMFNLFRKANTQFEGALNDMVDQLSDAGRTARQSVRELDDQIQKAEESVADVSAELRLIRHQKDKADEEAAKWDTVARQAAAQSDRDVAIEAVQRQVHAEELSKTYAGNVANLAPKVDELKRRLTDLRQRREDMQHQTSLLDAKSKIAAAESRAARYLGNVGQTPDVNFEALEAQVDRQEAKAEALAELANEKNGGELEARLKDFSRHAAVEDRLKALGLGQTTVQIMPITQPALAHDAAVTAGN